METWTSRIGFIFAAIGSALGIGNIWRFPALVGQNGGGAFLIPYLIATFLIAVPLMILELAAGRHLRGDVVTAFSRARKGFKAVGVLVCLVVFTILSYYLVITGWTLAYIIFSIVGGETPFREFTSTYQPVLFFLISALLTGIVVSLGVRRGVEKSASTLMPLAYVILIVLVIFSPSLSGFSEGAAFFLSPDFSVLLRPGVWGAAIGQAFFSLSVGFGVFITYGSYLEEKTGILGSSIIITLADFLAAILAGLVIFPIVFTYGLEPTAGAELAFTTLPLAFRGIPYGNLVAVAFFALLFFAALSSAISMVEVEVAALSGTLHIKRRSAAVAVTLLALLFGSLSALSYSAANLTVGGAPVLDIVDNAAGTVGLLITSLLTSVVFSWYLARRDVEPQIRSRRWTSVVIFVTRYIVPAVIVAVLVLTVLA